jgi:formylglycine-generating enzyme required for sulfatase activity
MFKIQNAAKTFGEVATKPEPQWQRVTINLQDRRLSAVDMTKVESFGFHYGGGPGKENVVWIDEMTCHLKQSSAAPTTTAPAPQSNAQPGEPWTNSLGMKFVPVPGTKVLFSIWDTRVQDYQAFVSATGRLWERPSFGQGPTHPAVLISWHDAKAFCAWLTENERREGTLKPTQQYRLPTALEWSAAISQENETGTPQEDRSRRRKNVFPWGTQWPPPHGAGNYAPSLGVDDFDYTSPVGSFAANRLGLYDMNGNVSQWCEDIGGTSGQRATRCASWESGGPGGLSSLYCGGVAANGRWDKIGFRCVLAGGDGSAGR